MKRLLFAYIPLVLMASCKSEKSVDPIILITKESGIEQLYKMDENGRISLLLNDSVKISNPIFSPNRKKLAYMSEDFGNWDIHIYDLESGEKTNLTNSPAIEGFPAWSPDGNKIAFMSSAQQNRDIYISNIDGSGVERITTEETIESEPLWSPSLKNSIYYKSVDSRFERLYLKNFETGETREIGLQGGARHMLRSIPGKNQISYILNEVNNNSFVLFDEDEMKSYSLLETPSRMSGYAWSPNAERLGIAINGQIEVYNYSSKEGLTPAFIIEHAAYPAWSADGKSIYYNKRIEGDLQLFILDIQSDKEKQLTSGAFDSTDAMPY